MGDLEELERLADALPILVWMANPDGELFFLNKALLEFTAFEGDFGDQGALFDTIHPDDLQGTYAQWARCIASGENFSQRFRLIHHSGEYRWTYTRVEAIRDEDGNVVRWYGSTMDIHEQKLLEDEAQEQSRRLASTLGCIVDGYLVLDDLGCVVYSNERAAAMLGLTSPGVVGREFGRLLPEQARQQVSEAMAGLRHDAGPPTADLVYLPGSGCWCELRCFRHEDGTAVSLRDVTVENRNFRCNELQARVLSMIHGNLSLSRVLDELVLGFDGILPDAVASVLLLDEDGTRIRLGSAPRLPQDYLAATEGVPIGPYAGSCGTAMYRRERVVVADIASDPLWRDYRDVALAAGLRACWSTPLFDGAGKVLGSFAVYYHAPRDPGEDELLLGDRIAHLASLAIQVYRQEAALRESEERFRQMNEAMDDVFWMEDIATAQLIYLSPRFEALSGYPMAGYDEVPEHWNHLVHPDDRERIEASVARSHEDWALPAEGLRYRIVRADGEVRWVSDRAFLIRDDEGRPWRLFGVIRDITDQLELERQLRASQRMESLGQLTGGIAHDFNNLLTVILGNAELLGEELDDRPRMQQLAHMVETAAQRGSELTQRLLAFARRQPLEPRVVAVAELVDEMVPLLQRSLGQHIEMRIEHQQPMSPALVDPTQLESSLLNLCLNARDAMPAGGVLTIQTAQVSCGGEGAQMTGDLAPGEYIQLTVADTGGGIPAEDLERIFEPFYTTKAKGKGTGLGLAMVYGFARQSQGMVMARSEQDVGSTFYLYLPVAGSDAPLWTEDYDSAAEASRSEWILLVEDDALVRNYVHRQLEGLGYRVHTAADGYQALAVLRTDAPVDLMFTDVVMPGGLNGPELARKARTVRPGLKVLYTSGFTENALEGVEDLDGMLLLNKPYRRAELAAKLRRALDG